MASQKFEWLNKQSVLLGIILTGLAFLAYVWNYTNPPYLYWDENYHIASAQKYLNDVYFMEPHPPLGKMLIAAGEALFDANVEDDTFIGTDYAKQLPPDFSFQGYRFFPVILAWLLAPLLYWIFLMITKRPLWAFFLSFLYVFDNALVTHSRAAMLDSTMLFFCTAVIAMYLAIGVYKNNRNGLPLCSLLFGIAFGAAMATKALALIMVLLVPLTLDHFHTKKPKSVWQHFNLKNLDIQKTCQFLTLGIAGFLITYVGAWHLHFMQGKTVIPSLPDNGYYQASEQYKTLIAEGRTHVPLMLRENLDFLSHYSGGVPKLNLCKGDENGSPYFFWPLGARSINYRWETPDGTNYQYITLVANPAVWWLVFAGVIVAFVLLAGTMLVPANDAGPRRLVYGQEICVWFGMWASYMLAVSQIDRVMYLYHYFLPLLFSFILFAYVFLEIRQIGNLRITDKHKQWIALLIGVLIFTGFHFFRALTYYEPIDDAAFQKRMIFRLWDLECVNCPKQRLIATPISQKK